MNTINDRIKTEVLKIIDDYQVELVEYKASNYRGQATIRCLIDYPQGGITLDKCGKINKVISAQLQKFFPGLDYLVEVNSPGLDRPLRGERDFRKVKGRVLLLWLNEPVDGKQFIEAKVEEVVEGGLSLTYKNKNLILNFDKIRLGKQKFR